MQIGMRHTVVLALGCLLLGLGVAACGDSAPPEAAYWPTIDDHKIVILPKFVGQGATAVGARLIDAFDQYAATYVASKCLANEPLTSKGFRDFVNDTMDPSSLKLAVIADDVMWKLIAKSEFRLERGQPAAEEECERPFFYPTSGAEVNLPVGLYRAMAKRCIPYHMRDSYVIVVDRRAAELFASVSKDQSFLAALRGKSAACLNP